MEHSEDFPSSLEEVEDGVGEIKEELLGFGFGETGGRHKEILGGGEEDGDEWEEDDSETGPEEDLVEEEDEETASEW
jgi:hypothetical protein